MPPSTAWAPPRCPASVSGVTHVPGLNCYRCLRTVPECLLTSACSRRPRGAPRRQATEKFARAAETPFISFFSPLEMLALAREAGFREAQHVSAAGLTQRYFAGRTDGLRPSS